mmetsp:Transcript_46115/g.87984  ORF Transcript_46115/g.87984 Transcript_46115/m.87984 type:complete len:212 (-) Transcript_46115:1645-2280(-)
MYGLPRHQRLQDTSAVSSTEPARQFAGCVDNIALVNARLLSPSLLQLVRRHSSVFNDGFLDGKNPLSTFLSAWSLQCQAPGTRKPSNQKRLLCPMLSHLRNCKDTRFRCLDGATRELQARRRDDVVFGRVPVQVPALGENKIVLLGLHAWLQAVHGQPALADDAGAVEKRRRASVEGVTLSLAHARKRLLHVCGGLLHPVLRSRAALLRRL